MSEHEFWNELGNLYLISGAYEPAIHAYARSIELDRGFGRPYSNLALAFVHTGRYQEAVDLYHRSIELLTDAKEKAVTWNRLGILYRQIKDYQGALVAYEQADKLDSRQDQVREQASRDVKYPLSVTMPTIDLQEILDRRGQEPAAPPPPAGTANDSMDAAEPPREVQWFEGDFVPPDPLAEAGSIDVGEQSCPEPQLSVEEELLRDISLSMVEEGWVPLELEAPLPLTEPGMPWEADHEALVGAAAIDTNWAAGFSTAGETRSEDGNSPGAAEYQRVEIKEYQAEEPAAPARETGIQEQQEAGESANQWAELSGKEADEILAIGTEAGQPQEVEDSLDGVMFEEHQPQADASEDAQTQLASANLSAAMDEPHLELEPQRQDEAARYEPITAMEVTEPQPVEYSQVEYPLVELTPAEVDSIQIDIARFKRILQINPRNAFAWDTLGGLYKSLGRFKDAITSYQQAIALDSGKPSYYYQLGLMFSAERREGEAMEAFQKVLSMDPHHSLAHASLGRLYRRMGLNDLASQHIDIALKDVYEEDNQYNQACLEAICGNAVRALELLQLAIEDNPSYVNWAQHDPDLDVLRHDQRFHLLIQQHAHSR
jgi:tetratricopeptide (TPR) repeat protein